MKNRVLFIVLFLGMCAGLLQAQNKQGNIWYFGNYAGIDFNNGTPVALTNSAMYQMEGCSSIADSLGNLLFYTSGNNVWNKQHQMMPNGWALHGGLSSSQSALIVQQPGSYNLYYIFTADEEAGSDGFCYSIVDMNASGGLGDVIQKNVQLLNQVTEKITACFDSTGLGVWVITHDWGNSSFLAYHLTSSGLNLVPTISNVGPLINGNIYNAIGCLQSNTTGSYLAMANENAYPDKFYLFNFDNSTGTISNQIILNVPALINGPYLPYGVAFSQNGEVLYGTVHTPQVSILYQWDLSSGNAATINASILSIPDSSPLHEVGAIALAPDKKIYCAKWQSTFISVINNPDIVGLGCNYVDSAIYLLGMQSYLGLPNFNVGIFKKAAPAINLMSTDTLFCEKHCIDFYDLSTNSPTSWQWLFPGADSLTSTLQNPTNICYNIYGSYDVTLIACNAAGCDTLHLTNFINCYQNPTDSIYQSNDTLFSLPAFGYQWYEVTNGIIAGATNQYFIPQQAGSYYCIASDSIGCAGSSGTIVITGTSPQPSPKEREFSVIPNPFGDKIIITFKNKNFKQLSITIKNVLGQNVYSRVCSPSGVRGSSGVNGSFEIDLSSLPQGIYFLDANIDGESTVKKIVKK
ncbi:MAG: T9SS type A sorting domain-containing protein [Bacteroidia bacterium]